MPPTSAPSRIKTYSATVAAGGTATVTIQPTTSDPWNVSQVSVEMPNAPAGATCNVRRNGFLVTPIIPAGDAAAGEPAILLGIGDALTVEWAGCTVGAVGKVLVVYDLVAP